MTRLAERGTLEPEAESSGISGPGASYPATKEGWPKHRSLQTCFAVDVSSSHACQLAGPEEAFDGLEVGVQDLAAQVGFYATKAFAGQGEELDGIKGCLLDFLAALQGAPELGVALETLVDKGVVAGDGFFKDGAGNASFQRETTDGSGLLDVRGFLEEVVDAVPVLDEAIAVVGV